MKVTVECALGNSLDLDFIIQNNDKRYDHPVHNNGLIFANPDFHFSRETEKPLYLKYYNRMNDAVYIFLLKNK